MAKIDFIRRHPLIFGGRDRFDARATRDGIAVLISGESSGSTYGSRRGVTIATIEGSLGLDFRAVILAGLRPLGTYEKIRVASDLNGVSEDKLIARREGFKKNINFLYTGCSRAKDELTIILSAPMGDSIYMDLLRKTIRKDN